MPGSNAAAAATVEKVPLFQFMTVRAPGTVEGPAVGGAYIRDDVVQLSDNKAVRNAVDLHSETSPSRIGRMIYRAVFCPASDPEPPTSDEAAMRRLRANLLELLTPYWAPCSDEPGSPLENAKPLPLEALEQQAWIEGEGHYYLLPDRLDRVEGPPLVGQLEEALAILGAAADGADGKDLDVTGTRGQLEQLLGGQPLHTVVFDDGEHAGGFRDAKRVLFDVLYLLYVLRRWARIDLGPIMGGLRGLHTLEALAVDQVCALSREGRLEDDPAAKLTLEALRDIAPHLRHWDGRSEVEGMPLIGDRGQLATHLAATPIVHPLFARLFRYAKPFNDLRPVGIGDLKVVKQWLTAYTPGEICDIHNVMKGESKERTHRRLEKTEETFSVTNSREEDSTRDTQSTDRFELKREAEQVLKHDLNINAKATFQYKDQHILAGADAGFSQDRSSTQTDKLSQSFSREVVTKAVTRIQTRTTSQRTVTKLFETEETNKHGFSAVDEHISGIYRWVDKRYRAQLFNYGKRMMFEFVLPEPAAFFVESRLRAFESTLDNPQPPPLPTYRTVQLGFGPADIDEARFNQLRTAYDLDGIEFPATRRTVAFVNQERGSAFFTEKDLNRPDSWYTKSYTCRLNARRYQLEKLRVTGTIEYKDNNRPPADDRDRNLVQLSIDGTPVWAEEDNLIYSWQGLDRQVIPPGGNLLLTRDDVDLVFTFQDIERYDLALSADLSLSAAALHDWQTQVHNLVHAAESKAVEAANQELKVAYDSRMADYRNRVAELRATAVNELLQGRSEAFNRELIQTELRRQCLAMLAREFDADMSDDLLGNLDSISVRPMDYLATKLEVDEGSAETTVRFRTSPRLGEYPAIRLDVAKVKGRHIQFLEQAFEWQHLAYLFYPYFWSSPPRWVQLMGRSDDADSNLTAFLQAGAVRVLVAVTPAYDEAVLHYLATREPWEGGPAPAIGDPLFLPLHEELHKQQDDLYGAVAEGQPWEFTVPTSLVYLHGSSTPLPDLPAEQSTGP